MGMPLVRSVRSLAQPGCGVPYAEHGVTVRLDGGELCVKHGVLASRLYFSVVQWHSVMVSMHVVLYTLCYSCTDGAHRPCCCVRAWVVRTNARPSYIRATRTVLLCTHVVLHASALAVHPKSTYADTVVSQLITLTPCWCVCAWRCIPASPCTSGHRTPCLCACLWRRCCAFVVHLVTAHGCAHLCTVGLRACVRTSLYGWTSRTSS